MATKSFDWDSVGAELETFSQEAKARNKNTPFEFWLPNGGEAEIVILRDDLLMRVEHTVTFTVDGKKNFRNIPCLNEDPEDDDCPLCEYYAMNPKGPIGPRTLVAYSSIIVLGDVVAKNGKTYSNQNRVLRMKSATIDTLLKIRKKAKTLAGLQVSVSRSNDSKSPSVGNTWLPGDKLTEDEIRKLQPEFLVHDWNEVLPQWTDKEVKRELARVTNAAFQEGEDEAPAQKQGGRKRGW